MASSLDHPPSVHSDRVADGGEQKEYVDVGLEMNTSWLLLIALTSLGALGCERGSDRAQASGGSGVVVTSSRDGTQVVAQDERGNKFSVDTQGEALPEGWPGDVPLPPHATITAQGQSSRATTLVLKTNSTPAEVLGFYEHKLAQWEQKTLEPQPNGRVKIVRKQGATGRQVMVATGPERDSQGNITIHLAVNTGSDDGAE